MINIFIIDLIILFFVIIIFNFDNIEKFLMQFKRKKTCKKI